MDLAIGVTGDESGDDALALGAALAHATGDDVVLVNVHPVAYDYPSRGNVDAEWDAYLVENANDVVEAAAEQAREKYGLANVTTLIHSHRSSGTGLAQAVGDRHMRALVIGSAPGASRARLGLGSTADQLLHGSPCPVAIAPLGYRRVAPASIGRLVVAYQRTRGSGDAVAKAVELAAATGMSLQLLTVVLRSTTLWGSRLSGDPERDVLDVLAADAKAAQAEVLERLPAELHPGGDVVEGGSAAQALDRVGFAPDDLLILASAGSGPLSRVFLGDMTYKLLRATPVPALVLPRHR